METSWIWGRWNRGNLKDGKESGYVWHFEQACIWILASYVGTFLLCHDAYKRSRILFIERIQRLC